jgi:hypothetical protein
MSRLLTASAPDVTQKDPINATNVRSHVARVNNEDNSSYSNCVVHDDTFDWGG